MGKQREGESGAAMKVARRSSAWFVTLLASSTWAHATVVEPRELDELVKEAEYIGDVWIEQATSIADGPAMTYPACGASYHARAVDAIKGRNGVLTFYSTEELVVGREYLVLLSHGLKSATAVASWTSLSGAPVRTKQEWLTTCSKRFPGLWAIEGSEVPFIDRRQRVVFPGQADDRWVARPFFLVRSDGIPEFDVDATGAPLSFGHTPYPSGIYLSWRSVRALLAKAALKAATSNSPDRVHQQ